MATTKKVISMYKYIPCDQSNDYFIAKLGPIISYRFESKVFELAKKMISGYSKGFWRAANANGVPLLIIDDTANITIKDHINQEDWFQFKSQSGQWKGHKGNSEIADEDWSAKNKPERLHCWSCRHYLVRLEGHRHWTNASA